MSDSSLVILHTDGAAKGNPGPAGIGVVLEDATGEIIAEVGEYLGMATNNEAEYRAVIRGVSLALENEVKILRLVTDSELVARQLTGVYKIKQPHLQQLAMEVHSLACKLDSFEVEHTLRAGNARADKLASDAALKGMKAEKAAASASGPVKINYK